jgi:transposase
MSDDEKIHWARRISREKIRQLYRQDAQGIVDEELIDEVGTALYARCQSILLVSNAQVRCLRCREIFDVGWDDERDDDNVADCPTAGCGWQVTYRRYHDSWRRRHLISWGIQPVLREFMAQYKRARRPQDKMILIDGLLHEFHRNMTTGDLRGPAARNLIEGKYGQVLALLEELAYGEGSTSGLRETKDAWREEMEAKRVEE